MNMVKRIIVKGSGKEARRYESEIPDSKGLQVGEKKEEWKVTTSGPLVIAELFSVLGSLGLIEEPDASEG